MSRYDLILMDEYEQMESHLLMSVSRWNPIYSYLLNLIMTCLARRPYLPLPAPAAEEHLEVFNRKLYVPEYQAGDADDDVICSCRNNK